MTSFAGRERPHAIQIEREHPGDPQVSEILMVLDGGEDPAVSIRRQGRIVGGKRVAFRVDGREPAGIGWRVA